MRMNSEEKLVVRTRKNKSLGSVIMEYRQRNGWTQEELAWRARITREHVGRIERDKCVPSVQTLKKLDRAFCLPEMTLIKEWIASSEPVSDESEDEHDVNHICQELGRALAANLSRANLNDADLLRAREAISTATDLLNSDIQAQNKK